MHGNTSALFYLKGVCAILMKKICVNRNVELLQVSKHTVPEMWKIASIVAPSVSQ